MNCFIIIFSLCANILCLHIFRTYYLVTFKNDNVFKNDSFDIENSMSLLTYRVIDVCTLSYKFSTKLNSHIVILSGRLTLFPSDSQYISY